MQKRLTLRFLLGSSDVMEDICAHRHLGFHFEDENYSCVWIIWIFENSSKKGNALSDELDFWG